MVLSVREIRNVAGVVCFHHSKEATHEVVKSVDGRRFKFYVCATCAKFYTKQLTKEAV